MHQRPTEVDGERGFGGGGGEQQCCVSKCHLEIIIATIRDLENKLCTHEESLR